MHDIKRIMKRKPKTYPVSQTYQNIKVNSELLKDAKQKAHSIVLKLLDVCISKELLSETIPYITCDHYEDVIIERAIIGVCGYPLCSSSIESKQFENQTYVIRHNKVYDVTQRQNFCSNKCYEASEIIYHQIPTTPLYLRSSDAEVQNLKLIIPDLASLKGKIGKRINVTGTVLDPEIDLLRSEEPLNKENVHLSSSSDEDSEDTIEPTAGSNVDVDHELSEETKKLSLKQKQKQKSSKSFYMSLKRRETDNSSNVNKKSGQHMTSPLADIYEIEQLLREWTTFETLRLILGDVYVKGMLDHMGKIWQDYDSRTTDVNLSSIELRTRYIALCKKLEKEELKERILDSKEFSEEFEAEFSVSDSKNPVPDYEVLKRDVEQISLKVTAFYGGNEQFESYKDSLDTIEEEEENPNNESGKETKTKNRAVQGKDPDSITKNRAVQDKGPDSVTKNCAVQDKDLDSVTLPLIDNYSQKSWRRQIVLEKLNKRLSEYSRDLGIDEREVRRLVKMLIATFDLSSHNISFKMNQWKFVTLILIKMLSVRYPAITRVFTTGERSNELVETYLKEQGLDQGYLNRLLSHLTDISYILSKGGEHISVVAKGDGTMVSTGCSSVPRTSEEVRTTDQVRTSEARDTEDVRTFEEVRTTEQARSTEDVRTCNNSNDKKELSTNFEELD